MRIRRRRRGSILPLLVVTKVFLLCMVALAIDLGMLAVARTQCQAAADAAALAGARTLTGDPATDFNKPNAAANARKAAKLNAVIGSPITDPQVTVTVGSYRYDAAADRFVIDPAGRAAGDAWTLCQATVTSSNPAAFARIFNVNMLDASAVATAAHRPRDVAIVIDFSGSMRLNSLLGAPVADGRGLPTSRDRAMIAEGVYPTFGHYSAGSAAVRGSAPGAPMLTPSGEQIGPSNLVETTDSGPAVMRSFFQDAAPFGSSSPAFTPWSDGFATAPGGLRPKAKSGGGYAKNVNEILGRTVDSIAKATSTFVDGQGANAGYGGGFASHTAGPRYWGKTFFVWPPDPRGARSSTDVSANNGAKDWRQRFFIQQYLGTYDDTGSRTTRTGGGGGGGGGNTGGNGGGNPPPPPPPPPPPLNVVPDAKPLYAAVGGTGLTVGAKQPLRINALMFNGGTDLSKVESSGDGGYRVPGSLTEFQISYTSSSRSTTSGGVTTTVTTYRRKYHVFIHLVNYDAILAWLKEDPQPFPPRLRAGGVVYYSYIPSTIDTSNHPIDTSSEEGRNQRFWKEYIDEALGIQQYGFYGNNGVRYPVYNDVSGKMGYGGFYSWNSPRVYGSIAGMEGLSPKPDPDRYDSTQGSAYDARYMDYRDNPRRPRLQFWFSPMTMVDFLGNMNVDRHWLPGTIPEAPIWQAKAGVQAALGDIKSNHPNDLISLISFSKPQGYGPTTGTALQPGTYNAVRSPLSRDYGKMANALYFPTQVTQSGREITPFDAAIADVPRSIGGTCYAMGLMLAYNQFSRPTADGDLRTFAASAPLGQAGGLGRKGAQKMVIFQTDGVCSATAYSPGGMATMFQDQGPYRSYFKVRYDANGSARNEYPTYVASGAGDSAAQAVEVATRLCEADTARGYSTRRKPVRVHALAFGTLFESGGSTAEANKALSLLQTLQTVGGVQADAATPLAAEKVITGTAAERIDKLKAAFSAIMQDGYSVTLID